MSGESQAETGRTQADGLRRCDVWIALALATLLLIAGSYRMTVGVCGVYHDDGIYVATAKAMAEGDGYRLVNLPGAPLQSKYPILYPAILAALWRLWPRFPDNLIALQGLSVLSAAAVVGFGYLYLVRFGYFSRRIAAASGLFFATAPLTLYLGTQTLSEMPFAALMVMCLWAVERAGGRYGPVPCNSGSQSRRAIGEFALGVALGLPFLCRVIGITLIPAGLLFLAMARRRIRWTVWGAGAMVLPWVLWGLSESGAGSGNPDPYYTDYVGWWTSAGLPFLQKVVITNATLILSASASLGLEGVREPLGEYSLRAGFMMSLALGGVLWLNMIPQARRARLLPLALAAYTVPILICPWPPYRFLVPVLMFLVPYLLSGLSAVLGRLLHSRAVVVAGVISVALAVSTNLGLLHQHASASQRAGYPYLGWGGEEDSWSSYEAVFDWLGAHANADDVVASGLDSMVYLYTGLRAFRPFTPGAAALFYGGDAPALGTVDEFAERLLFHGTRFLVRTPLPGFAEELPFRRLIEDLRIAHPNWVATVYESADGRFVIYELRDGPRREARETGESPVSGIE